MTSRPVSRRQALWAAAALGATALAGCAPGAPRGRPFWSGAPEPTVALPPETAFREAATGHSYWSQDFARLLADDEIDLLILGEVHDNPDHHAIQAWTVSMLDQLRRVARPSKGDHGVAGLAFEMIPEAAEPKVGAFLASARVNALEDLDPLKQILVWEKSGWPAWEMYAPILLAAPGAVVTGGGVAPDALRNGMMAGAATWPNAADLGLDQPLAAEEAALRAQGQIASHCNALPADFAPKMVDAQQIRDAAFASALLRAERKGGGFSVLIAGNGHARRDWGVPRFIERQAPGKRVVSIGLLEARPGEAPGRADHAALTAAWGGAPPFDYVAIAPHRSRPDPCEAFRKRMEKRKQG